MWCKSLSSDVTTLDKDSDRICGIQYKVLYAEIDKSIIYMCTWFMPPVVITLSMFIENL